MESAPEESTLNLKPEFSFQYRIFCDSIDKANLEQARELAKEAFRLYLATRQTCQLINVS